MTNKMQRKVTVNRLNNCATSESF